jgi:hypothetical protein
MREIAVEASFRRMMDSPSMKIMHDDFQRYMQGMMRGEGRGGSGGLT